MKITGSIIVNKQIPLSKDYRFFNLTDGFDFAGLSVKYNCLIVKYLRPEYALLLPGLDLIITENGGALAHLSLLALAEGKHIILAKDCTDFPANGDLAVYFNKNSGSITIESK